MRWLLMWGGRWVAQQAWRGLRREPTSSSTSPASESAAPGASSVVTVPATTLAVICSTRRLFVAFADVMSRKRLFEADGFQVTSGVLAGATIVVARPTRPEVSAQRIAAAIAKGHSPGFFVSAGEGTSGGEEVVEGQVVVATQLLGPDGERLGLDGRVPEAEWLRRGRVDATSGQSGGPLAVDPWGWENALACQSLGIPLIVMTAIVRPCPARQSPGVEALRQPSSLARRTGVLTGMVWNRPKELKIAWQQQTATWQACDRIVKLVTAMTAATQQRPDS